MITKRLRDNTAAAPSAIDFTFDALNRQVTRTPTGEAAVTFGYDLRSLLTKELRGDGMNNSFDFDGFGWLRTEAGPYATLTFGYDSNGNRRKVVWSDGQFVLYDFDQLNRVTTIRENGVSTGIGVLASYAYNPANGQLTSVAYGNGTARTFEYNAAGRPTGVGIDLAGTAADQTIGKVAATGTAVTYNPAGQIGLIAHSTLRQAQGNRKSYAWTAHSNALRQAQDDRGFVEATASTSTPPATARPWAMTSAAT